MVPFLVELPFIDQPCSLNNFLTAGVMTVPSGGVKVELEHPPFPLLDERLAL